MPKTIAAQVFTFDGQVYAGPTLSAEISEGAARFSYEYEWNGASVRGSFDGTVASDGTISGRWIEDPPKGRSQWKGPARLRLVEAGGYRTLIGTWGSSQGAGRWLVDLP